jgi:hypothetical protein
MPKDSANNPSWLDKTEPIERNPHSPKPDRKTPELKEHRGKDEVLRYLDGKVPLRVDEVEKLNVRDERYTYVSITDTNPNYDLSSESKLATWRRRTRWGQGGTFGNPLVAPKPKATDRAAQDRLKDYKGDKKPSLVLEAIPNVAKTRWEISLENFGGITISAVARKKRGKWYAFVGYQDSESYRVIAHLMSADCSSAEQAFNRLFHVKRWFYVNGQWHDLFMPYKSVCITGFGHRTLPSDYVSFTYHKHVPNSMFAWEFERPEFVPSKQYVSQHITSLKTVYHLPSTVKEQLRQRPFDNSKLGNVDNDPEYQEAINI